MPLLIRVPEMLTKQSRILAYDAEVHIHITCLQFWLQYTAVIYVSHVVSIACLCMILLTFDMNTWISLCYYAPTNGSQYMVLWLCCVEFLAHCAFHITRWTTAKPVICTAVGSALTWQVVGRTAVTGWLAVSCKPTTWSCAYASMFHWRAVKLRMNYLNQLLQC